MGAYSIYWIRKEFSYHYFHKSDILYRFIRQYEENKEQIDLNRQFHYITNSFPANSIISHIKRNQKSLHDIHINGNMLEMYAKDAYITLHIQRKQLQFHCDMLHEAETHLFPLLRTYYPFLFVIENDHENYGWISPVTKQNTYLNGQVLYS